LARVRGVVGGTRIYVEFPNATYAWVGTPEPVEFQDGQVVLLFPDRVEAAPADLWREGSMISVVRIKNSETTVVEYAGHIRSIPTNDVNYEVGNTVELLSSGVTKVLASTPLSLLDFPGVTDKAIDEFEVNDTRNLGTFDDFGGLPDVIARARKLIETPLKYSKELSEIGAPQARGVLFIGEPGTGKTMLARIIARESGAAFFQVNGPEIVSKWLGQSEELLRKIFDRAKKRRSAILFFDEFDSIAEERRDESHEASRRLVAQLLTLMDDCNRSQTGNIIVIAATNRPGAIDPALRRPGRFDWKIYFPCPDRGAREEILKASSIKLNVVDNLPHDEVAGMTDGWTPADLAEIWKEAAILAVTDGGRNKIMAEDYIGGFQWVSHLKQSVEEYE
jgi:transitional endoplasmic reticulum ATPase